MNKQGFTLLEILIVMLVISILLVIAIPNFLTARENARLRACTENMKMIETAVEQYAIHYHLAEDISPPTLQQLYSAGYFKTMPKCPSEGDYLIEGTINSYNVECTVHGKLKELAGNL